MSDKVKAGTPQGNRSLCLDCRNAHVVRGLNFQERIYCRVLSASTQLVTFPVEQCSVFDDKRTPSLYAMEIIAWNVTSRNRGPVGFEGCHASEIHIEPPRSVDTPNYPRPDTAK